MPMFDVHYNRKLSNLTMEVGRYIVEAEDRHSAAHMVLTRYALSPLNTKITVDEVEDNVLPLSRKQIEQPPDTVEPKESLLTTREEKKEREINKAYKALERRRFEMEVNKPQLMHKFTCRYDALVVGLNEDHALRQFADELMRRAQKLSQSVSPSVTEVQVNVNFVLDQRRVVV